MTSFGTNRSKVAVVGHFATDSWEPLLKFAGLYISDRFLSSSRKDARWGLTQSFAQRKKKPCRSSIKKQAEVLFVAFPETCVS